MTLDPIVGVTPLPTNVFVGNPAGVGYLIGPLIDPAKDPTQFKKVICCFEAEWDATALGSCIAEGSTIKYALYSCKHRLEEFYSSYSLAYEGTAFSSRGWIVWYALVSYDPSDPSNDERNILIYSGASLCHSAGDDPPSYMPPCCPSDTPGCNFIGGYSDGFITGHPEWYHALVFIAANVVSNNHAGDPNCVDFWTGAGLLNATSITTTPGSCGACAEAECANAEDLCDTVVVNVNDNDGIPHNVTFTKPGEEGQVYGGGFADSGDLNEALLFCDENGWTASTFWNGVAEVTYQTPKLPDGSFSTDVADWTTLTPGVGALNSVITSGCP